MTALTAGEKVLLRATGHKAQLSLSVNKPASLLAAVVTGTPANGDRTITYGSGSGTGYASIKAGNPLWVGSAAGAQDKGLVRIRSISGNQTSGTLTLAENAVLWAAGDNLTIYDDLPLWPVYPWMGGDPVVWKKDGPDGIEYTDENNLIPPVAVMGPHRVGTLAAGTVRFYLDATASYAMAGALSSYAWVCSGGTINSASASQTYIDFTVAGQYWLSLTVTSTDGKTQTSYRRIWVYDANTVPYTAVTVDRLDGDWQRGGWNASITVYGAALGSDFPDRTLIVLTQDSVYGATTQLIGGYKLNSADARNIVFAGYIRGETISYDWKAGSVSFEAASIDAMLARHQMFSISLQHITGSQDKWWEFLSTTVAQALHHLWRWHSNLFDIADVFLPTSNTLKMKSCDLERGSLYGMADTFAFQHGIKAHVCVTKWGALHVEPDLPLRSVSDRAAAVVVSDLTAADCREELAIMRNPEPRMALVNLSGMAFDGAAVTPLVSKAPGSAPGDIGPGTIDDEGQVLDTQAQANALAGRVYAQANNRYPEIRAKMAGNYLGVLELVPQEWWTLSLTGAENPRGIIWTNQRMIPRHISAEYRPEDPSLIVDAAFETEAAGNDGVTGDYPTTLPDDAPEPEGPAQPPAVVPLPSGALSAYSSANGHFWRPAAGGAFAARNGGLSGANIQDLAGRTDPFWWTALKQNTSDPERAILWKCDAGHVYRSPDAGVTWQERTPITDPPNTWSDATPPSAATVTYKRLASSPDTDQLHYLLAEYQGDDDAWRGWIARTADDGLTWSWAAVVADDYILAQTAADSPYNVLLRGDSIAALSDDPDYGYRANGTHIDLLFTPIADNAVQTITFDYRSNHPTDWDVGEAKLTPSALKLGAYLKGTLNEWVSDSRTSNQAHAAGVQQTLEFRGAGGNQIDVRNIALSGDTVQGGSAYRPLWADVDASYLWVTAWVPNQLILQKLNLTTLAVISTVNLGGCTLAELNAATYAAYVFAGPATLYVYGKLAYVPGLAGAHLVSKSTDGAATWTSVVDATAWATGICGAFADLSGEYIAVRNDGTNKFYKGSSVLTYVSDTAFGVGPGSLTVSAAGNIAIGSNAGPNVEESGDDGATWTDISSGITAGGAISALTYV